jgi:hypothetical protein
MLVLSEPCNDSPLVRVARWGLYRASGKFDKADVAFRSKGLARLLIEGGYEGIRLRRFGFLAYLLAAFPDVLGALRYLPASRLLTKVLIRMDRILAWIPLLRVNGFHIILSANKPGGPE